MDPVPDLSVIIVAAGQSRRMGFDKLLAPLAGKTVIAHSMRAFFQIPDVAEVIVVTEEARMDAICKSAEVEAEETGFPSDKIRFVPGGAERQESVAAGVNAVAPETNWIAVHDGARPLVSDRAISDCLALARQSGAAACARPVVETVKRVDTDGFVAESIDRDGLWLMETPQIIRRDLLEKAVLSIANSGAMATDEVSALQHMGIPVKMSANRDPNPKITTPPDLELAETLCV